MNHRSATKNRPHTRNLRTVTLLSLLTAFSIVGCDDDDNYINVSPSGYVEQSFIDDQNLSADPEKGVVLAFLEPMGAPEEDNLTGELGFDVFPYTYSRTVNHTFCFTDRNSDSKHSVSLQTLEGVERIKLNANGACVTALIEPGDYEVVLTHGEHVTEIEPVFLRPVTSSTQITDNRAPTNGVMRLVAPVGGFLISPAVADDSAANATTLVSTNACENCDLSGLDLSNDDLTFADLTGANLSDTDLSGIELYESKLTGANLTRADLSGTDLTGSHLADADLTDADLTNAFITNADLTGADLTGADVTGIHMDDATLAGVTWTDGSTCNAASIGQCYALASNDSEPCDSLALTTTDDSTVVYRCLLPSVDKEECTETDGVVDEGQPVTTCTDKDEDELVTSVDLAEIFDQVTSTYSTPTVDYNTPIAILAWGGQGGPGENGLVTSGGDGGDGGFASTVTTLANFLNYYGQTAFYFYLGEAGTLSNIDGDGGSSTLLLLVESKPGSTDDVLLIAGGGGGGTEGSLTSDGADGAEGGVSAASQMGSGFVGVGQGVSGGPDGGSTDGEGVGGDGTYDGKDGIGGQGGMGYLGANPAWVNGDPDVGSDGRGGNVDDSFSSSGGGGGGGGYGGGGAGDGGPGAGGGSWGVVPTISCNSAPDNSSVPSSPGTARDDYFEKKNGAVEVWLFPDGCTSD